MVDAIVTNTGTATWLPSNAPRGGVALGTHLYDASGALVSFDFHTEPLTDPPREIASGETVRVRVTLPPIGPGPLPPRARLRRRPRHLVRAGRLDVRRCLALDSRAGA